MNKIAKNGFIFEIGYFCKFQDSSISFVNYSESGSEAAVYKQLQRTEVELKKYRKIYKL